MGENELSRLVIRMPSDKLGAYRTKMKEERIDGSLFIEDFVEAVTKMDSKQLEYYYLQIRKIAKNLSESTKQKHR